MLMELNRGISFEQYSKISATMRIEGAGAVVM